MVLEHEELTGRIIGAAIAVHKALGPGFVESFYENAFVIELRYRDIVFQRQLLVPVIHRGAEVGMHRLDLLVDGKVVVELKAVKQILDIAFSITRSYLRAVNSDHGLILNFAKTPLEVKRVMARNST